MSVNHVWLCVPCDDYRGVVSEYITVHEDEESACRFAAKNITKKDSVDVVKAFIYETGREPVSVFRCHRWGIEKQYPEYSNKISTEFVGFETELPSSYAARENSILVYASDEEDAKNQADQLIPVFSENEVPE